MIPVESELLKYQRQRWLRQDAHRWMRPHADRWTRSTEPSSVKYALHSLLGDGDKRDLRKFETRIASARWHIAALRMQQVILCTEQCKAFHPDQPRVPAGNPDGGQWIAIEYPAARIRLAQVSNTITDFDGSPYYKPGGHHEMSKEIYTKWNLQHETRQVFDKATTGSVPGILLRTSPDGVPKGHFWDGRNGAHGQYNEAVRELSQRFLQKNGIAPEQMTPNHANALLKEIRESEDPRIRDFNRAIRFIRRLPILRGGRGAE